MRRLPLHHEYGTGREEGVKHRPCVVVGKFEYRLPTQGRHRLGSPAIPETDLQSRWVPIAPRSYRSRRLPLEGRRASVATATFRGSVTSQWQ
jgi:hypothetical protein